MFLYYCIYFDALLLIIIIGVGVVVDTTPPPVETVDRSDRLLKLQFLLDIKVTIIIIIIIFIAITTIKQK